MYTNRNDQQIKKHHSPSKDSVPSTIYFSSILTLRDASVFPNSYSSQSDLILRPYPAKKRRIQFLILVAKRFDGVILSDIVALPREYLDLSG